MNNQQRTIYPNDWENKKLSEICEIVNGTTPSKNNKKYWGGEIPFVTPTDITNLSEGINFISKTESNITSKALKETGVKLLPKGTVLLTSRATIGEAVINSCNLVTNQGFKNLICENEEIINIYLLYYLKNKKSYLESLGSGSTFREISKSMIKKTSVHFPDLFEQRKIATVLFDVDKAIKKTKQITEQLKKVKKGLMQDLFTNGYFKHDKYRVFSDRTLNKYPKSWDIFKMCEVVDINPAYNKPDKKIDYIEMDAIDTITNKIKYMNKRNPKNHSGKMFKEKDILFARITPCTENGKIAFIEKLESRLGIGSTEFIVLSSNSDMLLPKYLYYYVMTHQVRDYAISRMRGTTGRQRVPYSVFENELKIMLPTLEEQKEIIDILENYDMRINCRQNLLNLLKIIKKGLMQDLLTGEVRTKDKPIKISKEVCEYG